MHFRSLKKGNQVLLFIALLFTGLYYGAALLVPLSFAAFFAALILPVIHWIERSTGAGKLLSSFIGTFIIFIGVGVLLFFFIQQLGIFLQDIIDSQDQILAYIQSIQVRAADMTGYSPKQQEELLEDSVMQILNVLQTHISNLLLGVTGLALNFLLILILMFLVLLNRDKFHKFLMMYIKSEKEERAVGIITEARKVAYKYLWGRLQVMTILAAMYLILFTAYGLKHSGLLILFGALITIIPYIGPFVSGLLPIIFLIIFGGSTGEVVSFTILIAIVQLIESYVLEPVIIGSEVEQSPLFIILAIILGGIIWGPAGFILFVPIFSILKILFDHTKGLEPVGYLLGNKRPDSKENLMEKIKKSFRNNS
jgi:predicted PurR-regulated permease PerM